jgi:hypothetical protein
MGGGGILTLPMGGLHVKHIEQTFDKVWTTGLIAKLIAAKITPHFIRIIHIS